ncbi:hypothetical protein MKS88_002162 [Plasmodium brasilianum]|uniref:Uncharacterized protein n=1 Tax=Plasmodium brasilianum TaxID=5824 RepID=A0ACB9YBT1_PLABR|nr:hypothetical protein MKS88_002162 [Plasmodium brasilianum]
MICTISKFLDESCNLPRIIDTINCRYLAKYKQNKYSDIAASKEGTLYSGKCEENDISYNGKGNTGKNKKYNRNSLNKAEFYTEVIDYNNGMFDGKLFHFEKKWTKKKKLR